MPGQSRQNHPPAFRDRSELLDEVNLRLLTELHADPRISMSALARRVQMSAPAVTERVQRLERVGVITGEDCFLVKVHARAVDQLEELLDQFLLCRQTTTSIVVTTPVASRPLPLTTT